MLTMRSFWTNLRATLLLLLLVIGNAQAQERRAPPPEFSKERLEGIFFDKIDDAFPTERPTLSKLRSSSAAAPASSVVGGSPANATTESAPAAQDGWAALISPASLEDEIKRIRLHFDSVVTTPAAFSGGGYQEARLDLTVLATLFAVINEHGGEVRWKDQAAAARDLIARTAFNCKAGSTQVYNEAKLRKADLQELISGAGLADREATPENQWASIAGRAPLMEYLEQLSESLSQATRDEATIKAETDLIKRNAELLATVGEVLVKEGMEQADDGDYAKLSRSMTESARSVVQALERTDLDAVRQGAAAIRQRCDACHEQYR
jgi:cytochrome c556